MGINTDGPDEDDDDQLWLRRSKPWLMGVKVRKGPQERGLSGGRRRT